MRTQYSHLFDTAPNLLREEGKLCDHAGCVEEGTYRAPRRAEGEFYWFCMEHVRAYNASWNYFQEVPNDELESHIRKGIVWDRPSWPLYERARACKILNTYDFEEFAEVRGYRRKQYQEDQKKSEPLQKALTLFDLSLPFSKVELRMTYRKLVKAHHPDIRQNPLDREKSTVMIQDINAAYTLLKDHITA